MEIIEDISLSQYSVLGRQYEEQFYATQSSISAYVWPRLGIRLNIRLYVEVGSIPYMGFRDAFQYIKE